MFMTILKRNFLDRFSRAVDELKYGNPWEENVKLTPLPEPNKPDYYTITNF